MSSRILVVEDEKRIADFVVRGLAEEGYQVEHSPDGPAGQLALEIGTYDLVILDWWLPGIDGIDLLRQFRARDRATPVLFLTARDTVSERVAGLDAGADDYLCKPFAFEELLARIRAMLRRPEHRSGVMLDGLGIRADLGTQKVTRDGSPIELTAKEFSLLCLFLRHQGTVLSRTRIYDAVWGDQYDGLSNTIEVHVKELRRKLEAQGPRVIQTRRGRGYVFEPESHAEDF
jgi:DNA-binding response OmpR family regulator